MNIAARYGEGTVRGSVSVRVRFGADIGQGLVRVTVRVKVRGRTWKVSGSVNVRVSPNSDGYCEVRVRARSRVQCHKRKSRKCFLVNDKIAATPVSTLFTIFPFSIAIPFFLTVYRHYQPANFKQEGKRDNHISIPDEVCNIHFSSNMIVCSLWSSISYLTTHVLLIQFQEVLKLLSQLETPAENHKKEVITKHEVITCI